ncbi:unnamed protein product [Cuscuta campestris]|uniref:Integrase catalytic domain-containing protein n=1 Tax=Cuscuta campestris TaxID=132261 RepID=A0A484LAG7_9ASTE|nr:unnamed protein product [Cuscuta campestris]
MGGSVEAAKEGGWLKNFITELGVVPSIKNLIPLFCDNNEEIAQAKEPRSHQKTKHIVRRYHIIREIVARGDVEICKIEGLKIFSKGLSELLRNSKELNNHLPKPLPIQEGLGLVKICKDEGWRCYNGVPSATICDEEQINTESRVIVDLTMEKEMESLQRHTPLAEVPLNQGCLDIFHQVIKDNMNLFRKSIACKQFLDALNKGQILNYSEEVVRVTREAIKSFEYIDAATMEGASHSINLRYILESQKLSGENFLDWEKNLQIVLDCERKLYTLKTDPPKTPKANARASELTSFKKYEDDARDVKCIIMASMTAELQRLHADMEARPMIHHLRDLLQGHPKNSGIYVIEVNMSDFTSWVMDTGCGSHICTSMQNLHEVRHLTEGEVQLKVGNGALVNALAVGTYVLSLPSGLLLHLNNCLFVPPISRNIISVSCLDKAGFSINVKDKCLSVSRNDIYYATAKMTNGLYILDLDATVYNVDVKRSKPNSLNLTYLWHCHLGHINEKRISKLRHSCVLDSFDLESYDVCQSCLLARGGFSYFVTFTDDLSRYGYVYLMKHKSECFDKYKEFRNEVEKQLGKSIKTLRSDRGGEYLSLEFDDYLKEHGILSQLTPPALLTAAHTLNRVPSKAVESTPYELWRGTKPNLSYLMIWGCDVYVRRLMTSGKLDSKSDRCKFVGYPKETKGYEFYHPTDNKIFVARHGTFLEKEFLSAISSGRKVDLEEIREPQEEISIAVEPERQDLVSRPGQVLPCRSDRMRNPSVRYGFLVSDEGDVLLVDQGKPETYLEAITCPESEQWLNAMKSEMESMYANQDAFLVYGGEEKLKVIGYTDASFQTDRDDYKSQAGYVFCLNGGAFSWKSSKQDTTADSTTEAEYMAAAEAAKEGVWIKKFISELGVVPSINDPIPLFCDNTGAIAQAKEPRSHHQKTKHIIRRYHIIREIVYRGDIEICKVETDDNIADPLTKPLGKLKHEGHTRSMGIRPMTDWP